MKLERALFDKSYLYFIFIFAVTVVAFWLSYFTRIFEQESYRMHTHGGCLILWCLLLIVQPYLIRINKRALHKQIGLVSYVLVPLILVTTTDLLNFRMRVIPKFSLSDYFNIALVMNALIAFAVFYALAMINRKRPEIHARYMVCTVLPMFSPITDRIINFHFRPILSYLPALEGNPLVPIIGFVLADLTLIGLCVWDWKTHKRWNVFPVALGILLLYHISVLEFYKFSFWQSLCGWAFPI